MIAWKFRFPAKREWLWSREVSRPKVFIKALSFDVAPIANAVSHQPVRLGALSIGGSSEIGSAIFQNHLKHPSLGTVRFSQKTGQEDHCCPYRVSVKRQLSYIRSKYAFY